MRCRQSVDIFRPMKLWFNNRKLNAAINQELKSKIERRTLDQLAEKQGKAGKQKRKSIIDLALTAYEKETALSRPDGKVEEIIAVEFMPQSLRSDLIDSIKTFFFAGHDTTVSRRKDQIFANIILEQYSMLVLLPSSSKPRGTSKT